MATIIREVSIEAPAERVWDALADIGALHTRLVPGFVVDTKLEPGARIVIQSLLPTDDPAKNRALVQPVNAQLRAFAASTPGLAWLDLYPAFVDAAGAQRKELFNDGLHPSRDGYQLWADRLTAFLEAR